MVDAITIPAVPTPKLAVPAIVLKDESDVRRFLNRLRGDARFKDIELVRILDSQSELATIKEKFSKIPNTGALFNPPPLVASIKGGALCPFVGEGILVSIGGVSSGGWQARNSNLCIVCHQYEKPQVILHEMLHYIHQRASGGRIKFNQNGHPTETLMPEWIKEGFPALFYRESLRGYEKELYDGYTNLLELLEEISQNEGIAREAFLFGDLRRLQQIVDERLGKGTFEEALAMASSSSNNGIMEALDFLSLAHLKAMQRGLKLLQEDLEEDAAKLKLPEKKTDEEAK